MTDAEALSLIQQDLRKLATDSSDIKTLLAVVADKAHNSPCEPVTELQRALDKARGGMWVGLTFVAVFSAITGGVAALIAIFK